MFRVFCDDRLDPVMDTGRIESMDAHSEDFCLVSLSVSVKWKSSRTSLECQLFPLPRIRYDVDAWQRYYALRIHPNSFRRC